MQPSTFERERDRFQVNVPIEAALTPPASWYTDGEFLAAERARVFARSWQYACPLDRVRSPGDYVRVDLFGDSYLVVRGEDGSLRAFHNVCRHHAAQLLEGEGCVEKIVCPYHGWTYALDGSLKSAPQLGGVRDFEREDFGLPPLQVETWGPLVFLHAGTPQRSVRDELEDLEPAFQELNFEGLRWVARRTYPMGCNWKVFVDNYLDGGYHIAHLHGGLASQIQLEDYETRVLSRSSVQTCPSKPDAKSYAGEDFSERIGAGAVYAWVHPNLMLNRYGPILDTNWVVPLGPERCEVVFDYWFTETEGAEAQRFIERSLAASDQVQLEDVGISESVQRGLGSSSYDCGRYAPQLEIAMHHFHKLLAADLRKEEA